MLKRSNLGDFFLEDALPSLEFVAAEEFMSFAPRYEMIFNVGDMKGSIIQSSQISALEAAGVVEEGAQIPTQDVIQGYDKTYKAVKYGLMVALTQEAIDDGNLSLMEKHSRRLSQAFMEACEIKAAAVLNNGLAGSENGPDGVPLFSLVHPLLKGGTNSNKLATAADLSATTLKALITLLRQTRDTANNRIHLKPAKLIVPADLEFTAHEILKSSLLVDSANASVNATNAVKDRYSMEIVVNDYLTDSDACMVLSDKDSHELHYFWRARPAISTDTEFKSEVKLMKISGRFDVGFSDYRGIVGTEGAA